MSIDAVHDEVYIYGKNGLFKSLTIHLSSSLILYALRDRSPPFAEINSPSRRQADHKPLTSSEGARPSKAIWYTFSNNG